MTFRCNTQMLNPLITQKYRSSLLWCSNYSYNYVKSIVIWVNVDFKKAFFKNQNQFRMLKKWNKSQAWPLGVSLHHPSTPALVLMREKQAVDAFTWRRLKLRLHYQWTRLFLLFKLCLRNVCGLQRNQSWRPIFQVKFRWTFLHHTSRWRHFQANLIRLNEPKLGLSSCLSASNSVSWSERKMKAGVPCWFRSTIYLFAGGFFPQSKENVIFLGGFFEYDCPHFLLFKDSAGYVFCQRREIRVLLARCKAVTQSTLRCCNTIKYKSPVRRRSDRSVRIIQGRWGGGCGANQPTRLPKQYTPHVPCMWSV